MRLEAEADSDDDDDDRDGDDDRNGDGDGDGDDKCTLVVSLMQKYARAKRTRRKVDSGTDVAIGFNIYKVCVIARVSTTEK